MRPRRKGRWQYKVLAVCLPLVALGLVDVGLRLVGMVLPEDPLVFYARTYAQDFSPFVETPGGQLTIRPD